MGAVMQFLDHTLECGLVIPVSTICALSVPRSGGLKLLCHGTDSFRTLHWPNFILVGTTINRVLWKVDGSVKVKLRFPRLALESGPCHSSNSFQTLHWPDFNRVLWTTFLQNCDLQDPQPAIEWTKKIFSHRCISCAVDSVQFSS